MKRVLAYTVVAMFALVGSATAVPPGQQVDYTTSMGTVTFKGDIHAGQGVLCTVCHMEPFQMKANATEMSMQAINEGKFCGKCHNGETAFKTSEGSNCTKCHIIGQ